MSVFKSWKIHLTPDELADLFTNMNSDEQAEFFSEITRQTGDWPGAGWCQQSYSIIKDADKDARETIRTLASHLPQEDIDWIVAASRDV